MKKSDLVAKVQEAADLSAREADAAVAALLEQITNALSRGEAVGLVGFGAFALRERQARTGRNPATGLPIAIPASRQVAFKPGKALRDAVGL